MDRLTIQIPNYSSPKSEHFVLIEKSVWKRHLENLKAHNEVMSHGIVLVGRCHESAIWQRAEYHDAGEVTHVGTLVNVEPILEDKPTDRVKLPKDLEGRIRQAVMCGPLNEVEERINIIFGEFE